MTDQHQYKIEKGILPGPNRQRQLYPFREMELNDSFFLEATQYSRVVSAASWFGTRNNKKFSIRRDGDGYRCWRIA